MKIKSNQGQTYKNILMNVMAFAIQFFISFYMAPIIVGKVGGAAYGFLGLANDFVAYAGILASIFNSVAARFIANAFYKNDFELADNYFNSLIVANTALAGVLGVAGIALVPNLDRLMSIPSGLVFDVKLTFAMIFASYIVSLLTTVFTTSTFVTNRTDIQGVRNIVSHLIRLSLIIIFLNFISVKIYWVALATMIASIFISIINLGLTKKLTPEIHINLKYAKKKYAWELAKSGCWMAFTSISVILMRGLDLIIANKMLGEYQMGLLSIARTMPNNITSIIGTIAPIFTPVFILLFSKGDIDALVGNVKKSINSMAVFMFVPICGFIVYSYDFYALWQKSLSLNELMTITILSSITVTQAFFNSTTSTMAQLSVVTNKLKLPVLVSVGCGIFNVLLVFVLIKFTPLGIYSIVISSTVIMVLRYVIFNSFYGAYIIHKPLKTFMGATLKTWLSIPVLLAIMAGIRALIPIHSWKLLILDAALSAIIGYIIMVLVYSRQDVKKIIKKVIKK